MISSNDQLHAIKTLTFAKRSGIKSYHTGAIIVPRLYPNEWSSGWSHYSEHTLGEQRSVHAEIHAIVRMQRRRDLEGATIYVGMVRAKSGNVGLAKPCAHCFAVMADVGIARCVYTDNDDFGEIRL